MKMVLTRLGEGSKMVVTGDPSQVDLPRASDSGLVHAVGLLNDVKGVGVSRLTAEDVVRHELVARIVRAYDSEKHD
jgi:phosphate starvation-inducible protein PhoH and related proteins